MIDGHFPGDRPSGRLRATRSCATGRRGMIATSQGLASAAGLGVFFEGGNAVDAAVTAAAVLSVVEPTMNGIGGDLLALVYDAKNQSVYGLDSTGRSAYAATPEEFARRGLTEMPARGPLPVDVPGAVEGWCQLLGRFGTIDIGKALEPAIALAHDGFALQELIGNDLLAAEPILALDPAAARTFMPGGRAPGPGDVFRNPNLARSLETIAAGGRDAFYLGPLARAIVADLRAREGLLDEQDFADHRADWVNPIWTSYRGLDVLEMPPSTQGIVALEMLNLMEGFDVAAMGHNSADFLHLIAEAKKIAFADRGAYLADRDAMPAGALHALVSKEYADLRRPEIDLRRAGRYAPGELGGIRAERLHVDFARRDRGDTVYLTAADAQGNVISIIQSLFASFGAGIVAGDTGIVLHNRGAGFTLAPGHPNQVGPHKRPLHTLVPAMILRGDRPWVSFGVMGGDNQAQAHTQLVAKLVDFGMDVQRAGESARVRHIDPDLAVESGIDADVRAELISRGHTLVDGRGMMGGFQGIAIDPDSGVMFGGSDPRKDGCALGW
jgi:gamma-glutamyltranspeptidase/glutathione hydrolase